MRVQQNSSRIPGNDCRRRKNCHGPTQTWRNTRLAYPHHSKTNQVFPWIWQFLQTIHSPFSELARPLNDLTKKDKKWEWTDECQNTFDTLKKKFTEEPVLMMPDHSKPFQIESDAFKVATGAVLTQLDSNGDQHPCSFISKTFSPTERNYEIYDRELLGIIRALEEWRHYIQGSGHTTIIHSDHKNLTYFRTAQKLNQRQARWSLYLSEFEVKLVHMPGTKMIQLDTLSRRLDHGEGSEQDNDDMIMLPEGLFLNLLDREFNDERTFENDDEQTDPIKSLSVHGLKSLCNHFSKVTAATSVNDVTTVNVMDMDLQKRIAMAHDMDINVDDTMNVLLGKRPNIWKDELKDWRLEKLDEGNVLFFKGKNYVPKDDELRKDILRMFHDHEMAGHPGELEMYNSMAENYWWPGLRS